MPKPTRKLAEAIAAAEAGQPRDVEHWCVL
jgi:hypothetical protein